VPVYFTATGELEDTVDHISRKGETICAAYERPNQVVVLITAAPTVEHRIELGAVERRFVEGGEERR
jgi:hypothetical protein